MFPHLLFCVGPGAELGQRGGKLQRRLASQNIPPRHTMATLAHNPLSAVCGGGDSPLWANRSYFFLARVGAASQHIPAHSMWAVPGKVSFAANPRALWAIFTAT